MKSDRELPLCHGVESSSRPNRLLAARYRRHGCGSYEFEYVRVVDQHVSSKF